MTVEYCKTVPSDYEEVTDLASYVFSAHTPTNFVTQLPKLYAKELFDPECHFIVKENGRIRAVVGSYPMNYKVCGQTVKAAAIGMVAVHQNSRSKGYMRELMKMALEDMRSSGTALGCLCGLRQRYEYFGFTPCGVRLLFKCGKSNIRHVFGKDFLLPVTLREITGASAEEMEAVWCAHHKKIAYIDRPREQMEAILRSWGNKTIGVWKNGVFAGYFIASEDKHKLFEVNLIDYSLLPGVINAYLNDNGLWDVHIDVYPHETAMIAELSVFAESMETSEAYNFNVLDFPGVLTAFLKLKSSVTRLPEGMINLCIKDDCDIKISVSGNEPFVTEADGEPELTLTRLEAMRLLFSTAGVFSPPDNDFLRALLPISLFIEESDKV